MPRSSRAPAVPMTMADPSTPDTARAREVPVMGRSPVRHTDGVDIQISEAGIRLGQLLKFSGVVMDGGEAKALIAGGGVRVDGEPEIRRGRQLHVGTLVEIELAAGRQELRLVALDS